MTKWTLENLEDNPSFSGDIRLYSHSGLCNRLRLIASYKHLSDIKNKDIEMFWVKSVQCNALFKDLFKPIPNINFTYLRLNGRVAVRPKNTAIKIDLFPHDKKTKDKNHLIFNPLDSILEEVEETKKRIGGEYIACHIRRTDIITIQKKYKIKPPSDEIFERFIEDHPNTKVFLATDNKSTQDKFIEKFTDRIFYSVVVSGDGSKRSPRRTTSIQDAVKDMFLCIGAKDFIGTPCSSFSSFIENYRSGNCLKDK
jgi:hypothetical protein|tara:strand:+ start:1978 stop:2739 length:762 start_codon:yes stop_codon:yes gene_type:complete